MKPFSVLWRDFTVEHRGVRADSVGEFLGQRRPLLERVAVAGDQLTMVAADVCQGAEAVQLGFKEKVGVIERLRDTEEPQG